MSDLLDPTTMSQINDLAARIGNNPAAAQWLTQQLAQSHQQVTKQAEQAAATNPAMSIKQVDMDAAEYALFQEFQRIRGIATKAEDAPAPPTPAAPDPAPADDPGAEDLAALANSGDDDLASLDALELDAEGDVINAVGDVVLAADEVKAMRFVFGLMAQDSVKALDPRLAALESAAANQTKALRAMAAQFKVGQDAVKEVGELKHELATVKAKLDELSDDRPIFFDATRPGNQVIPGQSPAFIDADKARKGPQPAGTPDGFADRIVAQVGV